jgi:hypothetical protein
MKTCTPSHKPNPDSTSIVANLLKSKKIANKMNKKKNSSRQSKPFNKNQRMLKSKEKSSKNIQKIQIKQTKPNS